jgi:hypothetical protein
MKNENPLPSRMTRRQLAGAVLATAAVAQTPPPAPSSPKTPEAELQAAREQNQGAADSLAKLPVLVSTEPAFHFTA